MASGEAPLHVACADGRIWDLVQALLEKGARVTVTNSYSANTPSACRM